MAEKGKCVALVANRKKDGVVGFFAEEVPDGWVPSAIEVDFSDGVAVSGITFHEFLAVKNAHWCKEGTPEVVHPA